MHIQENHRNQVREKQNVLEEKDEKKIYQNDRIFKKHEQLNRKKTPCYKSKQKETISKSNKSFFFFPL